MSRDQKKAVSRSLLGVAIVVQIVALWTVSQLGEAASENLEWPNTPYYVLRSCDPNMVLAFWTGWATVGLVVSLTGSVAALGVCLVRRSGLTPWLMPIFTGYWAVVSGLFWYTSHPMSQNAMGIVEECDFNVDAFGAFEPWSNGFSLTCVVITIGLIAWLLKSRRRTDPHRTDNAQTPVGTR